MNDDLNVYCSECAGVAEDTRRLPGYQWKCLGVPKRPHTAIYPNVHDGQHHERCVDVNKFNNCNRFTPRPETDQPAAIEE